MTNWFLTRDEALQIAYMAGETEEFPAALMDECRQALAKATKQFDAARAAAYTPRRDYLYEAMREALDEVEASTADKVAAVRRIIKHLCGEEAPAAGEDYLGAATGRLADVLASLNIDDAKFNRFIHFAFEGEENAASEVLLSETEAQRAQNCAAILAMARAGQLSLIREDVTADEVATMLVYADGYRAMQKAERAGDIAAGTAKAVVNIGLLAQCIGSYAALLTLGFAAMEVNIVLGVIVMMVFWVCGSVPLVMLEDQEDTVQNLAEKVRPALRRIGLAMGSHQLKYFEQEGVTVQATVSAHDGVTEKAQVQATVTA